MHDLSRPHEGERHFLVIVKTERTELAEDLHTSKQSQTPALLETSVSQG